MQPNPEINNLPFDLPKNQSNVIKVIGVGGGGSNAINYMYSKGIKGVDFVVCNTDAQALENSPVENKIQLGINLTEGLGAGANPVIGEQAAEESFEDIKKMFETNTKMVFITAGMGGGTGTGAAPIISRLAKQMEILTVGIVTMPFHFEGKIRMDQAKIGVDKLRKEVDALIVINNNKLRNIYGNLGFKEGFAKADEVLATASKGIAEVITHHYTQNIDLKDAKTVLSNSGNAIMGSSKASGSKRAIEAISSALDSPLLNDNRITGAKNVLLLIVSGNDEITIDEIGLINEYIQERAGNSANIIMGVGEDSSLESAISVTVIATGFDPNQQEEIIHSDTKKIIHSLSTDNEFVQNVKDDEKKSLQFDFASNSIDFKESDMLSNEDFEENEESKSTVSKNDIDKIDVLYDDVTANFNSNEEKQITKAKPDLNQNDIDNHEIVKPKEQVSIDFDMPIKKHSDHSEKIVHELIEDVSDIVVNDPIHIIPVIEINGNNTKKSGFDNYDQINQDILRNSKNKKVYDPLNSPIATGLSKRTESRKIKLKEYNYDFNKLKKISEMQMEPAFKRNGIDLDIKESTLIKKNDIKEKDDDFNLENNNSFLNETKD
tara:strand:- start:4283 stop:6097 length:1815 start_codon:yes stop_codon:yes gene_type:complete